MVSRWTSLCLSVSHLLSPKDNIAISHDGYFHIKYRHLRQNVIDSVIRLDSLKNYNGSLIRLSCPFKEVLYCIYVLLLDLPSFVPAISECTLICKFSHIANGCYHYEFTLMDHY